MRLGASNDLDHSNKVRIGGAIARLGGIAVCMLFIMGALVGCTTKTDPQKNLQPNNQATPVVVANTPDSSTPGTLKINVPSGVVGDNFWIYVDGHLVSSPPHGFERKNSFLAVQMDKDGSNSGWELWDTKGMQLRMTHENFTGLDNFISAGLAERLFDPVALPLPPAIHTVELMVLALANESGAKKTNPSSFPFAVTHKYEVKVRAGGTEQIYVAVPDDFYANSFRIAAARNAVCPGGRAQSPDLDQLQRWMDDFNGDPLVQVLRRALNSPNSGSHKVAVLDLPPSEGGPREFEGRQINDIVSTIRGNHFLPSHQEVKECMEMAPQFSRTYTEYDHLVTDMEREIDSFRKLAER